MGIGPRLVRHLVRSVEVVRREGASVAPRVQRGQRAHRQRNHGGAGSGVEQDDRVRLERGSEFVDACRHQDDRQSRPERATPLDLRTVPTAEARA